SSHAPAERPRFFALAQDYVKPHPKRMTNNNQQIASRGGGMPVRALVMGPYRISLFPPLPPVQTVFGQSLPRVFAGCLIRVYSRFPSNVRRALSYQAPITFHSFGCHSWLLADRFGDQFPLSRFTMCTSIARALFSPKFTHQHIEDWSQQQPKERDADHTRKRCDTHRVPHFSSSAVRCNQWPDPGNKSGRSHQDRSKPQLAGR